MERLLFGHGFVPRIGRQNHRALDRALNPPSLFGDEPSDIPWVIVDGACTTPDTPLLPHLRSIGVRILVDTQTWRFGDERTWEVRKYTRLYCRACADDAISAWLSKLSDVATEHLARARAAGRDPAHGGDAASKRGQANRQHQREIGEWKAANERSTPAILTREILAGLQAVTAGQMAKTTGLSRPYCSMIKRGAYVPHPKHWSAFSDLIRT